MFLPLSPSPSQINIKILKNYFHSLVFGTVKMLPYIAKGLYRCDEDYGS